MAHELNINLPIVMILLNLLKTFETAKSSARSFIQNVSNQNKLGIL